MSNNIISNKIAFRSNGALFPDQAIKGLIRNYTPYQITLTGKSLTWGFWSREPADSIAPYDYNEFYSQGTLLGGIEGTVDYSLPNATFKVYWTMSTWGVGYNELTNTDPKGLYDMNLTNDAEYSFTVHIKEKE